MTQNSEPDRLETAARILADEPGWIGRTLARHVRRENGSCAGCGFYRPVRWPCVQVWLAQAAQRIRAERGQRAAGGVAAGLDTSPVVVLARASRGPESGRRGPGTAKVSA